LIAIISSDLKNELQDKLQTWQNNNCLRVKLTLNLNNWLQRVQRLQVLSMFSMLKILKDTKNLTLSGIEDCQKDWIHNQLSYLYNLASCDSLYKVHVAEICSNCNFIKIAAINNLLQGQMRFKQEDSLLHNEADSCSYCILSKSLHKVFNSLKVTSRANHSLWTTLTSIKYLRLVIKASVTLIHVKLIKFTAIEIIWLFQKEPVIIAQNVNISPS